MSQVDFLEIVTRGLMSATLLHVSNLHGGSCVLCSDAAAFLQSQSLDDIGAAFLSSPSVQLRLFWQEFSIISRQTQEKVLELARLNLAANAGRLVMREELSEFADSAADGAVIGVAASKLADGEEAVVAADMARAPEVGAHPDLFKFIGIGLGLCAGGIYLFGSRRAGLISDSVFNFLVICAAGITAATLWRFVALTWQAGVRTPSDFLAMVLRAVIYVPRVMAVPRPQQSDGGGVGGGRFISVTPGAAGAADLRETESNDATFYVRAAGALGGVVLGILVLRAEEYGSDKALAVTELAAEQYLAGATADGIAWDIMPVEMDEGINTLTGNSANILARFDEEMLGELIRRIEEGGAYRESFFETFRSLAAEAR